jgi:hypothetical protein
MWRIIQQVLYVVVEDHSAGPSCGGGISETLLLRWLAGKVGRG